MKENTDLSNQFDIMVSQCQRMNAGKFSMSILFSTLISHFKIL